jgi:hypothetical protein
MNLTIIAGSLVVVAVVIIQTFVALMIHKDATGRGLNPVVWTTLGFIPVVGLMVYLIARRSGAPSPAPYQPQPAPFVPPPQPGPVVQPQPQPATVTQQPQQPATVAGTAQNPVETIVAPNAASPSSDGGGLNTTIRLPAVQKPEKAPLAFLVVVGGPTPGGGPLSLGRGENTIGRDLSCQIVLNNDHAVSGTHAKIIFNHKENGCFTVWDQASTNGTYVNGEKAHPNQPLQDGDVIELGSTKLEFKEARTQAAPLNGAPTL